MAHECACYLEALIRLFYPADCEICRRTLELNETHLCRVCFERLSRLCLPLDQVPLKDAPQFTSQAWSLFPYEDPVRILLTNIKFLRKSWLLDLFIPFLRPFFAAQASDNHYDAMIPIPLSRQQLIEREFNQSERLAQKIRAVTRVPVRSRLLKKRFDIPPQSGLSRAERAVNLYGIFGVPKPREIQGKTFLLIDDIITTGKTAEEAAKHLKHAGAKRVDFFALAHTERSL